MRAANATVCHDALNLNVVEAPCYVLQCVLYVADESLLSRNVLQSVVD